MSLKHLLNHDDDVGAYVSHRPLEGWDDNGITIDTTPILQDPSWDTYLNGFLGLDSILPNATDPEIINYENEQYSSCFEVTSSLLDDQEQVRQWTEENASSQLTSTITTPEISVDQVCYGMIFNAQVRLIGDMSLVDSKLSSGGGHPLPGFYQMSLSQQEERFRILFEDGTALGEANIQLEQALNDIAKQNYYLEFEVFAPIMPIRDTILRATTDKEAIVRVHVNVYGSQGLVRAIGQQLSHNKIYLQRPDYIRPGISYDNPHILKLVQFQQPFIDQTLMKKEEKQQESEADKAEAFQKTINTIYSSLTRNQKLDGLEGDERLKTQLLHHQRQALDFMCQRESGPIPEEFSLWRVSEEDGRQCHRHVITNNPSPQPLSEIGGGILADEMGMGKSLSILALILRTLSEAHEWAAKDKAAVEALKFKIERRRSRATLIIASSDLMINEWFQEMKHHFDDRIRNALRTVKYHGINRKNDPEELSNSDIVITTYHTLYADSSRGKHPLRNIQWYRLVLDEAHIVRRQSTVLYRTVHELEARSRWCLTGTPIQNRLEDIGSLFAFIRIKPFHNMSTFRRFIALPFDEGGKRRELAVQRFTQLLDALCLRRTKDLLHLPDQHPCTREIEFSPEERLQYEQTRKMMVRFSKNQASDFNFDSPFRLFQVQLQLRILCNHGSYQQPFSWTRRKLDLLDEREAVAVWMGKDGEVSCSVCKERMPLMGEGSVFRRFDAYCRHILCLGCLEESKPQGQEDLPTVCPLCPSLLKRHSGSLYSSHRLEEEKYFKPQGRSSKIEALMADVKQDLHSTKSIIFSCWTHTLDLIGTHLREASITYRRIDGECPTAKREKILDEFAQDPKLRILIMTTGTGAVGLNLAIANRVFIVEPQWNPSVEKQAIARALRIGQAQSVQVTRYVVKGTIEQDMRKLQKRKLKMAGMAFQ